MVFVLFVVYKRTFYEIDEPSEVEKFEYLGSLLRKINAFDSMCFSVDGFVYIHTNYVAPS